MAEPPASPFKGLDKALLRSTQPSVVPDRPGEPPAPPTLSDAPKRAPTRARMHARSDAATHTAAHTRTHTPGIEALYGALQTKQRLASFTFRFRAAELEHLDVVLTRVSQGRARKPSKNDIVRLGLNWLLTDYEERGDESVLMQVLARM